MPAAVPKEIVRLPSAVPSVPIPVPTFSPMLLQSVGKFGEVAPAELVDNIKLYVPHGRFAKL